MKISISSFIELLRAKGFSLKIDGKDIVIKGHISVMTMDMKQALKEHKAEIIEHLRREQIALMSLEDFGKKDMTVKIYSKVLGKEVYFCSNRAIRGSLRHEGFTAYLPHELRHLIETSPDGENIKKIDRIKEIFPDSEIVN